MKLKTIALLSLSVFSPALVFGLGIRLPDQDPFATGRGEAFVATADNPSAIYYNPAGITQLEGSNVRGGAYGIYLNDHYTSPSGASFNTRDSVQVAPQLYYTYAFKDVPLSLGLGLYSPYGLAIEWPANAPFTPIAKKGSLDYLTLNPVIAWKIIPSLSIAAGPTINYGKIDLTQSVPAFGSDFRFKGDDITPGFNAGVLWQPLDQLSFGASYRSETRMGFHGPVSINPAIPGSSEGTAEFPFPQNIIGGVSFRPTPKWNFEVDVDWTDWHRLKTVNLSAPFPYASSIPFHWQSSFFYEFGVTRYFDNGWHLSGGYIYSENSVPDSTFLPIIPDSDRHIWSLGIGSKYKNFSWDATYQFAWGPSRTVNNASFFDNGTYEYISHAITVAVGYHF